MRRFLFGTRHPSAAYLHAVVMVASLILGYIAFEPYWRQPFIEIKRVDVEPAPVGIDPHVVYARHIRETTQAVWSVELINTGCAGSGKATYRAGIESLNWLLFADYIEQPMAGDCALAPGTYSMLTCYHWQPWSIGPWRRWCAPIEPVVVLD